MSRTDVRAAARPLLLTLSMGVAALSFGFVLTRSGPHAEVTDWRSYWQGWSYVTGRQPAAAQAGSWLASDTAITQACAAYADGFARLDGIADPASFVVGCDAAARETHLEQP